MIEGGLLQDGAQMKLCVLSAMHLITETDRLITPTTIKNCFVKCGFSTDHVSSNDINAVKVTEDEDDWHNLQPLASAVRGLPNTSQCCYRLWNP
jgi:hypothetical protein